jgi:hypothetical protein
VNFGYQALNETSAAEMVTVTNTGGDMLDISNIRPSVHRRFHSVPPEPNGITSVARARPVVTGCRPQPLAPQTVV